MPKLAKERARDRVYSDDELKALWKAFETIGVVGDLFKLQLLTAARPGEVCEMEWSELDLARPIWTQPSARTFQNPRNPDTAHTWLQKAGERVREESQVEDFRPHDLRRTCATRLAEMGVPDAVLKMILNHSLGSDITGVYNQYKLFEERKQALEAWAKRLLVIVSDLKAVGL